MTTYYIMSTYGEGPMAQTVDLHSAGVIVDALMRARTPHSGQDYWVRADDAENGAEFYWDEAYATVFSAECFA